MARIEATEHEIQAAFVEWVRAARHNHAMRCLRLGHAIPNGGGRSKAQAGMLKAEGVESGVPDWHLPVARGTYVGLWIEFKSKTGRLRDAQRQFIAELAEHGHLCVVCRSADEAVRIVREYLKLPPRQAAG